MVYWEASRFRSALPELARLRAGALAAMFVAAVGFSSALSPPARASVPAGGRAWELVTFREPASTTVRFLAPMGRSGDRAAYRTFGPLPDSSSGVFLGEGIARRGPAGWSSESQGFPFSTFSTELFALLAPEAPVAFSADLGTSLWLSTVPLTPDGPPAEQLGLYRVVGRRAPQFIAKVGEGSIFEYNGFADLSADGEKVVFTTAEHLLPGDAERVEGESIYEWGEAGLRLVDTGPGGELLSACGSTVPHSNGLSPSGRRVFFTTPAKGGCGGTKRVFMADLEAGTTSEISVSQCSRSDCNAPQDVTFGGTTPDGGSAFLVTAQQLTDDDEDSGEDLYRYVVGSSQLHLLSGGSPEAGGQVHDGVAYPSDDGSRVYFRATGAMTPGEANAGEKLFLADGGGMHLVAIAGFSREPQIQLSQSGARALFVTASKVVATDTDDSQDVYLYDADTGVVRRISSGSSGGNAAIDANVYSPLVFSELKVGDEHPFYGIDASGARIVFATSESLIPADRNKKLDVYEWHDGQLGLVTPGSEEVDAKFGGISRDGKTVLFGTTATLSWQDEDGGDLDLYAARLGGGFPEPPGEAPTCEGSTCYSPPRAPLARQRPASAAPVEGKRRKRIRLLRIRSRGRRGVVGARTLLLVANLEPGLVRASVWARRHGKKVVLARGRRGVVRPGRAAIRLRLTANGRRRASLRFHRGRLVVRQHGMRGASRRVRLKLGGWR